MWAAASVGSSRSSASSVSASALRYAFQAVRAAAPDPCRALERLDALPAAPGPERHVAGRLGQLEPLFSIFRELERGAVRLFGGFRRAHGLGTPCGAPQRGKCLRAQVHRVGVAFT